MDKILLDTDTISEIFKQRNQKVIERSNAYRLVFGYYTTSIITVMEIVKGWQKLLREDRIQQLLSTLVTEEILIMGLDDAILAGRIYADLERTGQPIGYLDVMIALISIQNNLVLVTGNTSHYQRIQNLGYKLKLDNWRL